MGVNEYKNKNSYVIHCYVEIALEGAKFLVLFGILSIILMWR